MSFLASLMYIPNLRMFRSKRDVGTLIRYLSIMKHSHVRQWTADILGELGDQRAVNPLIKSLQDESANVRRSAALALGRLGDRGAVQPLIGSLQDEDARVRRNATQALGQLGDKRAVEPLTHMLTEDSPAMQAAAVSALGQIGDPGSTQDLAQLRDITRHKEIREAAVRALDEIGESKKRAERRAKAAARARTSARDRPQRTRATTPGGAAQSTDLPPNVMVAMYIAQLDSPIRDTRSVASEELNNIGKPAVQQLIEALCRQGNSDRLRSGAALVLGPIGDPRARPYLEAALLDSSQEVRWAAKMGLTALKIKLGD